MKHANAFLAALISGAVCTGAMRASMAAEEPEYTVAEKDGNIELRDYESLIVAETPVSGSLEQAGNTAFRKLFNYIAGNNRSRSSTSTPAGNKVGAEGEKIPMTAPVSQHGTGSSYFVSFMIPSSYRLESVPEPVDRTIVIREIPARRVAAIRYSGRWTEKRYTHFRDRLEDWISSRNMKPAGPVIWARYNPPFTLWFMRRNEILIPVEDSGS